VVSTVEKGIGKTVEKAGGLFSGKGISKSSERGEKRKAAQKSQGTEIHDQAANGTILGHGCQSNIEHSVCHGTANVAPEQDVNGDTGHA